MLVYCGTPHWRVELPRDWCAQHGPGNVAIYHPEGVGVLQISSFRKSSGKVTENDLREMAGSVDASKLIPVQAGEFDGLRYEHTDGQNDWISWFIARSPIVLHITYISRSQASSSEHKVLKQVITSLKCPIFQNVEKQILPPSEAIEE